MLCSMLRSSLVNVQQNLYTTGVITTITKRRTRKYFKTENSNFEEFFDTFLATLKENASLKKKKNLI